MAGALRSSSRQHNPDQLQLVLAMSLPGPMMKAQLLWGAPVILAVCAALLAVAFAAREVGIVQVVAFAPPAVPRRARRSVVLPDVR